MKNKVNKILGNFIQGILAVVSSENIKNQMKDTQKSNDKKTTRVDKPRP